MCDLFIICGGWSESLRVEVRVRPSLPLETTQTNKQTNKPAIVSVAEPYCTSWLTHINQGAGLGRKGRATRAGTGRGGHSVGAQTKVSCCGGGEVDGEVKAEGGWEGDTRTHLSICTRYIFFQTAMFERRLISSHPICAEM